MKLAHAEQTVINSNGLGETKTFSIRTNAHAFRMLSSGLYTDKVRAVLREIGCNAYDAHVAAGIPDKPFVVKLPNKVDPQFYIQDWGIGLSHDEVMSLYTSYFSSTKQTSNEFTGAFGLGSKSPFSYTDSFTIVSCHGGKKRTYTAYVDNNGTPTVSLMTTEDVDADWKTGIRIGFSVAAQDFDEFVTKADLFKWFSTVPKIIGARGVTPPVATRKQDNVELYNDVNTISLLMGNVMYPIVLSKINGLTAKGQTASQMRPFVIRAPIGSVQVAASREELQYDVDSCKWLVVAVEKATTQASASLVAAAKALDQSPWDVKCTATTDANDQFNNYVHYGNFMAVNGVPAGLANHYNNILINKTIDFPTSSGKQSSVKLVRKNHRGKYEVVTVRNGLVLRHHTSFAATVPIEDGFVIAAGKAKYPIMRARSLIDSGAKLVALFYPDESNGQTASNAIDEANILANKLKYNQADIKQLKDVPLPSWYVPPGKKGTKSKPKQTSVAITVPLKYIDMATANTRVHKTGVPVNPVETFVVSGAVYTYNRYVRMFDKTADTDKWLGQNDWIVAVNALSELSKLTKVTTTDRIYNVSAEVARQHDLLKRGWKTFDKYVVDWASAPALIKAVQVEAAKWRPGVDYKSSYIQSQLQFVVWAMVEAKKDPRMDETKCWTVLNLAGVDKVVRELMDASVNNSSYGYGGGPPLSLIHFSTLRSLFPDIPEVKVTTVRSYVTIHDLEVSWETKFPAIATYNAQLSKQFITAKPSKLPELLRFLFS